MYIEKELGYNDRFIKFENDFIIYEELQEKIKLQFEMQNLGINYLKMYRKIPLEVYDWLSDQIDNNFITLDSNNFSVYESPIRMIILVKSMYEFLFVDIVKIKDLIDINLPVTQLRNIVSNVITIVPKKYLIKWIIIQDCLENDLSTLEENYWNNLINRYLIKCQTNI